MYFVDRKKIDKKLIYIDHLLDSFSNHSFTSTIEHLALERLTHMLIESILDVGSMMIDGFIMRDAGSYEDIIDILVDENVIPEDDGDSFKAVIQLRKMIVRDYLEIDHKQVQEVLASHDEPLAQFSTYVSTYIQKESRVAHTFVNEETEE